MFPVNLISRMKSFPAYANMRKVADEFETRLVNYFESDNCWLDEREQKIVFDFFKEEKTLQKIGEEHFITRERVRQIISRSVEKLDYINSKLKWFYDDDKEVKKLFEEKEHKVAELTENLKKLSDALVWSNSMYFNDDTTLGEIRAYLKTSEDYNRTLTIDDLDLSVRTHNCLYRANIENVLELTQMTEDDLMKLRNFGKTCLVEIKEKLSNLGYSLREE